MNKILPQTFSTPADTAVGTMIYAPCAIIVPKLANVAVMPCRSDLAMSAKFRRGLRRRAEHAQHSPRLSAVQVVIFSLVMAMTARVPPVAIKALDLHVSLVMLAP